MKHNLSERGEPMGFKLNKGCCVWTGHTDLTERDILVGCYPQETSALKNAKDFLREQLARGFVLGTEVQKAAEREGISLSTLRRAREKLKVLTRRNEFGGPFYWSLPDHDRPIRDHQWSSMQSPTIQARDKVHNSREQVWEENSSKKLINNNLHIHDHDEQVCGHDSDHVQPPSATENGILVHPRGEQEQDHDQEELVI
jgi:hypothetical protein